MHTCEAIAHGAATVVNAISTGKGAAIGVNLWTRAKVELTDDVGTIRASILNDPSEQTRLAKTVVQRVLQKHRVHKKFGANVQTNSNIPIARGMKSSSVAANAVALATTGALGAKIEDKKILRTAVESAIAAGVTVTGAFDDASASYYGGFVVTDNKQMKIVTRKKIDERYRVLFHVPSEKSYTAHANLEKYRKLAGIGRLAYKMSLDGRLWEALTLNGLAHSVMLGWDPAVAIEAITAGAIASGLSGKGPATVAIAGVDKLSEVRSTMSHFEGDIIEARPNNKKAMIIGDNI